MSVGTILGFIIGIGLFIGAIAVATSDFMVFLNLPSLVMVVGGTLASSFISYEARYVLLSLKMIYRIVFAPQVSRNLLKSEVGRVIRWGYTVQKSGLPALEAEASKLKRTDRFMAFGVDMVISGYTGEEVRDILNTTIETSFGRNTVQANILKTMGAISPAFGMIGTLVGLVIMLGNLSDPENLGPALAVALVTTLYGVLFARLLFIPVATKIQQREEIVRFRNYLVAEGLSLLAERRSPRYIQDKMNSFLDPAIHFNIDKMKK
ncbi:MAG: flagellar motor protein MotA [Rhodospirillaceae bacterium]|nr:flagellar motor protein MotA [Rhodospirillaceae bacterium]MBT7957322.1 flagellar motor protein MotA [Rhodospirillaceae bacterium]